MKIHSVHEERFRQYGKVVRNIDFSRLVEALKKTPVPDDVVYEPSVKELEELAAGETGRSFFGEMPIQIGYCNGHNLYLNAVEYHRSSEINVAATDAILLLGLEADIAVLEDGSYTYDTAKMEAFLVPAGTAVELYATTLHYAPCQVNGTGFQVAVILPRGTNYPLEQAHAGGEDVLLAAKNKWLIAHPEGGLPDGTYVGLTGKNLCVEDGTGKWKVNPLP